MRSSAVVVYTPEPALKRPGQLARSMTADLWLSRSLAWRLFLRDIKALYRQSALGYAWAILPSVVTTFTFVLLRAGGVLQTAETPVPYPAFVLGGTLFWQTFIDAMNAPLNVVSTGRSMLTKINFPREALLLSGFLTAGFNSLIRLVLLAPVFWYYDVPIGPRTALFPLGLTMLALVGAAIGIFLTPVGVLYRDIEKGLALVTGFWFLLTPVVYPPTDAGLKGLVSRWNPVGPVLITGRDWLFDRPSEFVPAAVAVSTVSAAACVFAWLLYRLSLPHLIARIGNS